MPGTTVNYGFRIPDANGDDYQVPDDIRIPVTQIDAKIKSVSDSIGDLSANGWKTGVLGGTTPNDLKFVDNPDDFQLLSILYKRQLDIVAIQASVQHIGPSISPGDIVNLVVFTVPVALRPANANGNFSTGGSGPSFSAYILNNGGLAMSNLDSTLAKDQTFNVFGMYMI